jgi:hypothetical protein
MNHFPPALEHGALLEVAPGVRAVRGGFGMGPGVTISRTMTVLDTGDGLAVLNAVRLSDAAMAALDALGKVRHLVKLSDSHAVDEPYYADRYRPEVWSLPGARLAGLTSTRTLGPDSPVPGATVVDFVGAVGWREAALHVPTGGGTLVTCDVVQNCVDTEGASFLGRLMMSLMGFKGGVIVPGMWRRFQKLSGARLQETLSRLGELPYSNLVTGHGPPIAAGADGFVRAALGRASGSAV